MKPFAYLWGWVMLYVAFTAIKIFGMYDKNGEFSKTFLWGAGYLAHGYFRSYREFCEIAYSKQEVKP